MGSIRGIKRANRNKASGFVDSQVLILVRGHQQEALCIEDLVELAQKEFPKWPWTNDKIRNSINRLEARGKIETRYVIREKKQCRVPYLA
jgi:hypothetical protein